MGSEGSYSYSTKADFDNKPVNYVSFWDAARFTNWLTTGDTENGVYILTGDGINNNTVTRNASAWNDGGVAISNTDEWCKAAFYDPTLDGGTGGYYNDSHGVSAASAVYQVADQAGPDIGFRVTSLGVIPEFAAMPLVFGGIGLFVVVLIRRVGNASH